MVFQVNFIILRSNIRTMQVVFTNAADKATAESKAQASVVAPDVFVEIDSSSQLDATIIP